MMKPIPKLFDREEYTDLSCVDCATHGERIGDKWIRVWDCDGGITCTDGKVYPRTKVDMHAIQPEELQGNLAAEQMNEREW